MFGKILRRVFRVFVRNDIIKGNKMFRPVSLFIIIFVAQQDLWAMRPAAPAAATSDGVRERASMDTAEDVKYTYELCMPNAIDAGDKAKIKALRPVIAESEVKKVGAAGAAIDEEEAGEAKKEEARRALVELVMEHYPIVVARHEANIVGYLVFANKELSEKSGVFPVSRKIRAKNYCTIVEISIDKEHQKNLAGQKIVDFFDKKLGAELNAEGFYYAEQESSAVGRSGNHNYDRYAQRLQQGQLFAPSVGNYVSSRSGSRGARGVCCIFDCD